MGATVTTGKEVCAIRDPHTNEPVYLLFEETYDKRSYPHTPKWDCYAIGDVKEVMARIFLAASSCEGGMLQNRSGYITPEGYIQGWLKELAEPRAYPDVQFELSIGTSWRDLLKPEDFPGLMLSLSSNERAIAMLEVVEKSDTGRALFQLHENVGALVAILNAANKAPWRVFDRLSWLRPDPSLGYAPKKTAKFDVPIPEALKVGRYNHLMKGEDGLWRESGWAYSIVGDFVARLWEAELREPGSYRKRIRAYRDAVKAAPAAGYPMRVRIDQSDLLAIDRWEADSLNGFMEQFAAMRGEDGSYSIPESEIDQAIRTPRGALVWEATVDAAAAQASLWDAVAKAA